MNKVDYYASIEAYKERNSLAHAGVQPKNPRKDHKYLYIDKNGRYVYDEPKGNTSRPYSSPNTTGGKDANSYIQSNYGRTQESMKNTSIAKQAQNSWAKSNEKTSSSTGRPYSTPNSYNMQSGKDKEKLALEIAKNQSLARIKEKQDAWKKEHEPEKSMEEKAAEKLRILLLLNQAQEIDGSVKENNISMREIVEEVRKARNGN